MGICAQTMSHKGGYAEGPLGRGEVKFLTSTPLIETCGIRAE